MKRIKKVGVVGAGAMGRGIVQIAAQSGLDVLLFDVNAQAVAAARDSLQQIWSKLSAKGKMTPELAQASFGRIQACSDLQDLQAADLVIEAVVERLDVKRELFQQLEGIVATECILATNTSSLSVTGIAAVCAHPERVFGYHFFNPVPLMKVVEIVDGLRSDPKTGDVLMELARHMGHTPVRTKDMPGFIVNHAGRGLLSEGLCVAQESVAPFHQIDVIMREQAGFRMGPFELLDLTSLDVSQPVMESIYRQFYDEPRFRPSPIMAIRYAGGLFGRKTGEGFYGYPGGAKQTPAEPPAPAPEPDLHVWLAPYHSVGHKRAAVLLKSLGAHVIASEAPPDNALIIVTPFGEDASTVASTHQLDAQRTVALDAFFGLEQGKRRVLMCTPMTQPKWRDAAHALFASDGTAVSVINDSAGFVAQRVLATIINIASDIAQQTIATPEDIDLAVSLGLGYPRGGPLAMGDSLGAAHVLEILHAMHRGTGDVRYRASLWLQRRVQLGLSLKAQPVCV